MKLSTLAAALLILLGSTKASAGALQRGFRVGAVVVASATVSARVVKRGSEEVVAVRTGGYRPPTPAFLVNGRVQLAAIGSNDAVRSLSSGGSVTIVY